MIDLVFEEAATVLSSHAVADYIFPVVSGIWLAFITANIITLRSLEAASIVALRELRWNVIRADPGNHRDAMDFFLGLGATVLNAANELDSKGFVERARVYEEAILSIQSTLTTGLQTEMIKAGHAHGNVEEEDYRASFGPFKTQALFFIINERDPSVARIRGAPIEWLAILELRTLARFVEKHGQGRRSDCDGRCSVCNRVW